MKKEDPPASLVAMNYNGGSITLNIHLIFFRETSLQKFVPSSLTGKKINTMSDMF